LTCKTKGFTGNWQPV